MVSFLVIVTPSELKEMILSFRSIDNSDIFRDMFTF